ncbi:MAG: protease inhibitor I42 family protein [Actinomycetota bacterium]|nr:protease inhibitor I42 family protein [Actinomycetota bacterium]
MKQSKSALVIIAAVLAALLLAVSGCSLDGEAEEYSDPAELIEVEKGEEFTIILESNPTTGYQWQLAEPLNEEILVLEQTEFEESEEELIGAGGEEKWTFKAEGLGETSVSFVYMRPWEEMVVPLLEKENAEEEEGAAEPEENSEETPAEEEAAEEGVVEVIWELEELPLTVTFDVIVVKSGTLEGEPKKYDDPESEIEVDLGAEFVIVLESNPATGYTWQLAEPLDEEAAELVKMEYEKKGGEEDEEEGIAISGEETWVFKTLGEGETEISFESVEGEKTFKVKVLPLEEEEAEE